MPRRDWVKGIDPLSVLQYNVGMDADSGQVVKISDDELDDVVGGTSGAGGEGGAGGKGGGGGLLFGNGGNGGNGSA